MKKRRAVSEVISTVLILAITMVGAVFVASIVQDSSLSSTDQTPNAEIFSSSVKLVSYDTRDSNDLSDISNLDNNFGDGLCTVSCNLNPDRVPGGVNGGTDFIVLQIRNTNLNSIYLHTIFVNGIQHVWSSETGNTELDATIDDLTGKNYPLSGKFSIIPSSNLGSLIQRDTNEVFGGEEVRIVLKLNKDMQSDIELWRPLQIHLNVGGPQPTEYIILSGDAR